MATIKLSSTSFKTANPKINVGDYTVETDTGLTKQGTGAYYNNTDYKTVNFDSLGKPLSAGVISPPSLISITGLIEAGTNIGITGVGTLLNPYIINCTLVPSAYGLPSVLAVDNKTNNIAITSNDTLVSLLIRNQPISTLNDQSDIIINGNLSWSSNLVGGSNLEFGINHYFSTNYLKSGFYVRDVSPALSSNPSIIQLDNANIKLSYWDGAPGNHSSGNIVINNSNSSIYHDSTVNIRAVSVNINGTVTLNSITTSTSASSIVSINGSKEVNILTLGSGLSISSGVLSAVAPPTVSTLSDVLMNGNSTGEQLITSGFTSNSIGITETNIAFVATSGGFNFIGVGVSVSSVAGFDASNNLISLNLGTNLSFDASTNTLNATGGGGAGTVTSVGLSMPSAFTVTSSPITTSGTIAITGAGTTAQYIDGTGALQTFPTIPSITGLVPYTGATSDVDLGEKELTTSKLWLYDAAGGPTEKGSLHYADEALHFENSDGETLMYIEFGFMQLHKTGTIQSNFFTTLLTVNRDHYLPDASGTIALTSNIGTWGALNYPTWTTGTPFVKMTAAGTFALDTSTYLTGNQSITLSGEASGTGTTSISVTLANSAVIAKVLTGYVSGAGTVSATDSILQAIQKLNGNIGGLTTGVSSVNSLTGAVALTGTANQISISAANVFSIPSNSQLSVAKLTNLTTNGFVKTSGSDGTLSIDTSTYLTGNQTITLSGDVTGSGTTSITTTVKSNFITDTLYRTFDGQLSVININTTAILTIPYNCTITGWTLLEISNTPITSTCVLAVSKVIYSSYYGSPSIVSGLTPSLTSAVKNQATGLSISATAGDVFIISITSLTSAQKLLINLNLTKT